MLLSKSESLACEKLMNCLKKLRCCKRLLSFFQGSVYMDLNNGSVLGGMKSTLYCDYPIMGYPIMQWFPNCAPQCSSVLQQTHGGGYQ